MKKEGSVRVLNLGCGEDRRGTDFIDLRPSDSHVIKCDVNTEKLPYKDKSFDKVIAFGLMEHLTNLENFFTECRRVLKDGGELEIMTVNAGFWGLFGKVFHGSYERIAAEKGRQDDRLYLLYTKTTLHNLLVKYKFRDINCICMLRNPYKKVPSHHLFVMRVLTLISPRFYPRLHVTAVK